MEDTKLLNNRYQLNTPLGRGGMATVYQARDLMLERDVAIKVLRSQYAEDPAFRERFRQEAKAAANLSHPNIVTIYDFGYDQSHLYIVMEFMIGKDLNTLIHERGRLSIDDGLDLAIKACKGIGYAHRAGLVHCDVKPHNLLVTTDWQLKVADFGIARALASIRPDERTEVVWGSPQYFSPEQAAGEPPSPASDVYSLGVVMYLMFTGQLPFIGTSADELVKLHLKGIPVPPRELNPFIPPELEEVILKVLSKEPSARYRTADQLGRVLLMVQRTLNASTDKTPAKERSRPVPGSTASRRATAETLPPNGPHSTPHPPSRPQRTTSQLATASDSYLMPKTAVTGSGDVDWFAVFLGLVATTVWGGLIPFLIWVYNSIF